MRGDFPTYNPDKGIYAKFKNGDTYYYRTANKTEKLLVERFEHDVENPKTFYSEGNEMIIRTPKVTVMIDKYGDVTTAEPVFREEVR